MRPSAMDAAYVAYCAMNAMMPPSLRKPYIELPKASRDAMTEAAAVEFLYLDLCAAEPDANHKREAPKAIMTGDQQRAHDVFLATLGALYYL